MPRTLLSSLINVSVLVITVSGALLGRCFTICMTVVESYGCGVCQEERLVGLDEVQRRQRDGVLLRELPAGAVGVAGLNEARRCRRGHAPALAQDAAVLKLVEVAVDGHQADVEPLNKLVDADGALCDDNLTDRTLACELPALSGVRVDWLRLHVHQRPSATVC